MLLVDGAGRERFRMGADLLGDSGGFIADIEILRGNLVKILHSATRESVEYMFDDSITALREEPDSVLVSFRREAPRRFDLVVGADGVHSNVRWLAFGEESTFVRDLGACVAVFRVPAVSNLGGWHRMYCVPGRGGARGRTAGVYPLLGRDEAIGMLFFPVPPGDSDRRNVVQQKNLVTQAFAGDGWEVPQVARGDVGRTRFLLRPHLPGAYGRLVPGSGRPGRGCRLLRFAAWRQRQQHGNGGRLCAGGRASRVGTGPWGRLRALRGADA